MKEIKIESKGVEYTIRIDESGIKDVLEKERQGYEENLYTGYSNKNVDCDTGEGYWTEEEYLANVLAIEEKIKSFIEPNNLLGYVAQAKRKKNGMLYKKAIIATEQSNNCEYIHEWHNTWIYNMIKAQVVGEKEILITYAQKVDTPG